MNEVRFHARKGQGAIEAAQILARAFRMAGLGGDWYIPKAWAWGVNFDAAMTVSESNPPYDVRALVVFYAPLLEIPDIRMGFEAPDVALVNAKLPIEDEELRDKMGLATVDATGLARRFGIHGGLQSLVAPMLGAYAVVTGAILGSHLMDAVAEYVRSRNMDPRRLKDVLRALEAGYENAQIHRGLRAYHCGDPEVERLLRAS